MAKMVAKLLSGVSNITHQFALILVVLLCLVIIGLMFLLNWLKSQSVNRIPDLLYQMDALIKAYVTENELSGEEYQALMVDIIEFLHINPQDALGAILLPSPHEREQSSDNLLDQIKSVFDGTNAKESLNGLLMLGGLLNNHNLGLNRIKNGSEYQTLHRILSGLQKRANATTNVAVNNCLLWSDGLYSLLLLTNYKNMPDSLEARLPAKMKAAMQLLSPLLNMVIEQRIAEVKDAIRGVSKHE